MPLSANQKTNVTTFKTALSALTARTGANAFGVKDEEQKAFLKWVRRVEKEFDAHVERYRGK